MRRGGGSSNGFGQPGGMAQAYVGRGGDFSVCAT